MIRYWTVLAALTIPAAALGQSNDTARGHDMHSGHDMPSRHDMHGGREHTPQDNSAGDAHAGDGGDAAEMDHDSMDHGAIDRSGMDHSGMDHSGADHSGMDHSAMGHDMGGTAAAANPPPAAAQGPGHAADSIWGADSMRDSRAALYRDAGGAEFGQVMAERLEARFGDEELYLWDVQAFYGGDIDRLFIKSEGEGVFGGALEDGEIQALWAHAIGPWFDLQTGIRQDLQKGGRTHAVLGAQGLAPYNIEMDVAAFLSDKGDLTARIEAEYDQKITQDLILQPRTELAFSAQDIAGQELGSGLTGVEAGLRLRYRITPQFAPYIGYDFGWKLGETRDIARDNGEDPDESVFVAGLRAWF